MSNSSYITPINKESFEALKQNSKIYLLDFWAAWCGPCKTMNPILEDLAKEMTDISFLSINVDENQEMANNFGITSIPTFYIIKMPGDGSFDVNKDTLGIIRGANRALDFKLAVEKIVQQ